MSLCCSACGVSHVSENSLSRLGEIVERVLRDVTHVTAQRVLRDVTHVTDEKSDVCDMSHVSENSLSYMRRESRRGRLMLKSRVADSC